MTLFSDATSSKSLWTMSRAGWSRVGAARLAFLVLGAGTGGTGDGGALDVRGVDSSSVGGTKPAAENSMVDISYGVTVLVELGGGNGFAA